VRSSWARVAIGDVARVVSGATPKTSVPEYWDGNLPWATPKDLSSLASKVLPRTGRMITPEGLASCAAEVLPAGSVLLSSRAPIGLVAINTLPMATNQGFKSLVPSARLDSSYLFWWLRAHRSSLEALGNGATFKEISKATVQRVEIPLPPLDEQRRIANVLDRIDSIRGKRARSRVLIDALEFAALRNAVSFSRGTGCRLDELVDGDDRINYGVVQPGADVSNGVPLIRISDLKNSRVDRSSIKLIDPVIERSYARSRVRGSEILVGCVGSVGKVALTGPADVGSNVARAVSRVPIGDPILRRYVASYLRSEAAQRYFQSEIRLVAQPTLNVKQLSATIIPMVPDSRRREFSDQAIRIDALRVQTERHLVELDAMFASLQSRAFAGDLDLSRMPLVPGF
jgi:type I restriction enzyme S subunit